MNSLQEKINQYPLLVLDGKFFDSTNKSEQRLVVYHTMEWEWMDKQQANFLFRDFFSIHNDELLLSKILFYKTFNGLNVLDELGYLKAPNFPQNRFSGFYDTIEYNTSKVPWLFVLKEEEFSNQIDCYVKNLVEQYQKINLAYVIKIQQPTEEIVFDNLEPCKVHPDVYQEILDQENNSITDRTYIHSFRPQGNDNLALNVEYSRAKALTGRLTVEHGPQILLIKKELRQKLLSQKSSRHESGHIWFLDYSALEPSVLLALTSQNNRADKLQSYEDIINKSILQSISSIFGVCYTDPYEQVLKSQNLDTQISRDISKLTTLSLLYGASEDVIASRLEKQGVKYPYDFIDAVEEFFQLEQLKSDLLEQHSEHSSYIQNYYGRLIQIPESAQENTNSSFESKLLNFYIQSTAVDVALFGFSQIINKIKSIPKAEKLMVPIFVLHDALVLDIHESVEHVIPMICELGETVPGFNQTRFKLKAEKIL